MEDRTGVPPPPPGNTLQDLDRHLAEWSREHLITEPQAGAIRAYEASHGTTTEPAKPRTAPVTEALVYLGLALAVAAIGVILGRSWSDLSAGVRMAIPGLIAALLFVVGRATRGARDPALVRASHVAWFLSTGAVAWCVVEVAIDGFDLTDRWPLLWTGAITAAYASALYFARPSALQNVAMLVGLSLLAGGALWESPEAAWSAIWALGWLWIVLAWRGRLAGRGTAYTIGTVAAVLGALIVPATAESGWMWIGVVNAAALIGVAVALRQTPMLVLAAIGLFQATIVTTDHYLGGGIGTAIGLLVAGVAVLGVALLVSRRRATTSRGADAPGHRP